MERVLLQFIVLGVLLVSGCDCHDFVTLNLPSRAPFIFHPTEELSVDLSEIHPLYLYASSQNDYTHPIVPENTPSTNLPRNHHHQAVRPRPQFSSSPTHHRANQRHNKPSGPPLTYGFQPKPSSNRQTSPQQRQEKHNSNQNKSPQIDRTRTRLAQEQGYQPAAMQKNNHQRNHFSENIQVQASVQQNRQSTNSQSTINQQYDPNNFDLPFNYRLQHFEYPEKFISPIPGQRRSNRNNQGHRGSHSWEENKKPANNYQNHQVRNENRNNQQHQVREKNKNNYQHQAREVNKNNHQHHQVREENKNNDQHHQVREENKNSHQHHQIRNRNRNEGIKKHPTFEDSAQAFKSRNVQNHGNNSPKSQENSHGQTLPDRHNRNKNERLNLQPQARSMRGDNKPQLPPRPAFNNGGVRINTVAGELPVVHLDSVSTINENPTVFLQNGNHHHYPISNEAQEKKTYLIIKAPSTEAPTVAPFVLENLKYTSPPYILNNLAETTLHIPEIYATVEPRSLPNNAEPPLVLDLVQIPDHTLFSHQERHNTETIQRPEFRTNDKKERNHVEHNQPTESYLTSPLQNHDETTHQNRNTYASFREDISNTKHQNKERNPTQLLSSTESYSVSPLHNYDDIIDPNEKNYAQFEDDTLKYQNKLHNTVELYQPTESYPTTLLRNYDNVFYETKYTYAPSADDISKYQTKAIPKPKIKEQKSNFNISLLQPISYSSSVSVVSVKQNVEEKTPTTKKMKTTLKKAVANRKKQKVSDNGDYVHDDKAQNVPGESGVDYPNYKDIPTTTFDCKHIKSPGFYADLETGCQVFHNCDTGMSKHSFMCPNGTIFHQELFICDWWYNVKCDDAPEFYSLNSGTFVKSNSNDDFKKK